MSDAEPTSTRERPGQVPVFIVLVAILIGLFFSLKPFLSSSPTTSTPTTSTPLTHQYSCRSPSVANAVYRPRKVIELQWSHAAVHGLGEGPSTTLTARLSGPFASVTALKLAEESTHAVAQAVEVDSPPMTVDDRGTALPIDRLQLLTRAGAGFYNLDFITSAKNYSFSGAMIIRVRP